MLHKRARPHTHTHAHTHHHHLHSSQEYTTQKGDTIIHTENLCKRCDILYLQFWTVAWSEENCRVFSRKFQAENYWANVLFSLIIYTSEQNPKGEEHAKMNLPPKARANEGLLLAAPPAIIIEGIMRAPKARAKKIWAILGIFCPQKPLKMTI